jgi:hypothetical protein
MPKLWAAAAAGYLSKKAEEEEDAENTSIEPRAGASRR